jgi:hypothetical protein
MERVSAYWQRAGERDERAYLGGSNIGDVCERRLWLQYRGLFKQTFPPRVLRLFERGRREELVILMELAGAGFDVKGANPDTGEQYSYAAFDGHFQCHIDGIIDFGGVPTLLECKTHNDRAFYKTERDGVLAAQPKYHAQMQAYMAMARLPQALYYGVNKNTDSLYLEVIHADIRAAKEVAARVARVLAADEPAPIKDAPKECAQCAAKAVCGQAWPGLPVPIYTSTKTVANPGPLVPKWRTADGREVTTDEARSISRRARDTGELRTADAVHVPEGGIQVG